MLVSGTNRMRQGSLVLNKSRVHQGSLILVNRQYPMRYVPKERELCPVLAGQPEISMECESAAMLGRLLEEVGQEAIGKGYISLCMQNGRLGRDNGKQDSIVGVSGYRTREEQMRIFEDSLKENGREFTEKYVAFPDHSEHQTGLAIDLAQNKPKIDFIRPDFPYEGICQKFREKMADFGFIERYPKEKQEVTGIGAEPWHFRYVGVPHARMMQKKGMALEEYVEWLKQFDLLQNPLVMYREGKEIRIGYVKAEGEYTRAAYGNAREYIGSACGNAREYAGSACGNAREYTRVAYVGTQGEYMGIEGQLRPGIRISGNNMDGFIITYIIER